MRLLVRQESSRVCGPRLLPRGDAVSALVRTRKYLLAPTSDPGRRQRRTRSTACSGSHYHTLPPVGHVRMQLDSLVINVNVLCAVDSIQQSRSKQVGSQRPGAGRAAPLLTVCHHIAGRTKNTDAEAEPTSTSTHGSAEHTILRPFGSYSGAFT